MGIRLHVVHYQDSLDNEQIKKQLLEVTGLPLHFDERYATMLGVAHPNRPKSAVRIYWYDNEHGRRLEIESNTPKWNYVEATVLYLLKRLNGQIDDDYTLPVWAGKKWVDAWPRSPLARMKAWWNGTLPT
jgi:hypothetical protein